MPSKRELMRQKARKELAKKGDNSGSSKMKTDEEDDKPPSFLSGMVLIFAGSVTFSIFYSLDQLFLGILASAGFIIIGMSRVSRASADRIKEETLKN